MTTATPAVDRARVMRFHPDGWPLRMQWLYFDAALFAEDEWLWRDSEVDLESGSVAYTFGSHAAAELRAAKLPYKVEGWPGIQTPTAVIIGQPQLEKERCSRRRTRDARLDSLEAELTTPSLPAEEVFRRTEERHPS